MSCHLTQLYSPYGVAVDGAGNLYIADWGNNRIRKVDSTGAISTFAGTGTSGFGGDGGAATAAQLYGPAGVAVDGAGNLYIADERNDRIRKVDSTGTINTVAGTGAIGFSGDGGAAQLYGPTDLVVDGAGNLHIADWGNHRIRKVDSTGTISTVAGTGVAGFGGDGGAATAAQLDNPIDMALDGAGNLYIADRDNHRIRKVDSTGTISTVAGTGVAGFGGDGGAAAAAQLSNPTDLVVDGAGNLYIADWGNHRIRKVDSTGTISAFAGTGTRGFSGDGWDGGAATAAQLNFPRSVALDGVGNLWDIADKLPHWRSNQPDPQGGLHGDDQHRRGHVAGFAGTAARPPRPS